MRVPGEPSFFTDLRSAIFTWGRYPALPIISVGLSLVTLIPEPWGVLTLPLLIYAIGWPGAERLWYLRAFRELPVGFNQLFRSAFHFVGRYLRLGLVIAVPIGIAFAIALANQPTRLNGIERFERLFVPITIVTAVLDVFLTFVTPALAFSTRSAREALGIGLRMLKDEWPACAWYVLAPPLVFVVAARLHGFSAHRNLAASAVQTAASTLFVVAFKGATTAFYMRRVEVPDDGATKSATPDPAPPPPPSWP